MFVGVKYYICVNTNENGDITQYLAGYGVADTNEGRFKYTFEVNPRDYDLDFLSDAYKVVDGKLVEK